MTYHSQNSKIKEISPSKIWSTFKGFDHEIINLQDFDKSLQIASCKAAEVDEMKKLIFHCL